MNYRSVLSVIASTVVVAVGCESSNEYVPPPPPKVTVAHPEQRQVQEYFRTVGQTRAAQTVELRSRVSGYLDAIKFVDGQLVEKGQLLFVIDKEPYEAAVQSAEAALAKAEASLDLAKRQLARTEPLVKRELDEDIADRDSAIADVQAAEAALRDAKLNLGYTEVTAPFAGRIGRHQVDLGNLVQPATTLLATIESVTPMHAYYTVSEDDLLRFMKIKEAGDMQTAREVEVDMSIGNEEDYAFHGRFDFGQFGVDPGTGTAECRAAFENEQEKLQPGLFVHLRIPVGEPRPRLVIPENAIGTNQRGDYLLVVNDENEVVFRPVELGESLENERVVLSGVEAGDKVIVEGLQRARPGSKVVPEEKGAAEATTQEDSSAGDDAKAAEPADTDDESDEGEPTPAAE
ncbi:efflux RND transporter periplasmic adaptor subunit [Aeoliella mucimassa]|nr:efflux RND transporter periplasmic adaptor subunit [Aeoliella mucimassa]